MQKVRIAICIGEDEYRSRFVSCLMKHYQDRLSLYVFESVEMFRAARETPYEISLFSDCSEELSALAGECTEPVLYLYDPECLDVALQAEAEEGGVYFVEKYQEVNKIVDEILARISDEVMKVKETGTLSGRTRMVAVYSLSENEYQLPFSVTFGSIVGEQEKVLLVDMQENSGFTQIMEQEGRLGMEELLVMAESGSYSKSRIASCIGHLHGMDFVYPAENADCLCEAQASTYMAMLSMLTGEMDYDTVILNLGVRFQGFAEILNRCPEIYLMHRNGGLSQWREYEFVEELRRKGYSGVAERMIKVEIPVISYPVTSFERLVEQWKWNEFGDFIRGMAPQTAVG